MANTDNIKVVIKVRPLIRLEREKKLSSQWRIQNNEIESINPLLTARYTFDQICGENSSTLNLYETIADPIVQASVNGFNGTIFAYGQTSSGKTHTMLGTDRVPGVIILAIRQILTQVNRNPSREYLLRVSYLEIYKEKVHDLLNDRQEIQLQDRGDRTLNIPCAIKNVNSENDFMQYIIQGNNLRKTAETKMNEFSSRSHTIFSIMIESQEKEKDQQNCKDDTVTVSQLNLVDLAGSESVRLTGATGVRAQEAGLINKSLLALTTVINRLSEDERQHINFRDSKLTRILEASLGGNSKTAIICAVTPAYLEETNATLGFAQRARFIENKPIVNEIVSSENSIRKMKKKIEQLEGQVEQLKRENESQETLENKERLRNLVLCLSNMKSSIIHYDVAAPGQNKPSQRRKTWAMGTDANSARLQFMPSNLESTPTNKQQSSKFNGFGQQIEYTDEEFDHVVNHSFGASSMPTIIERVEKIRNRPSLLKTPKSVRNMLNTAKESASIEPASSISSPIAFDKDKRIKSLEKDLEELQHFYEMERQTAERLKIEQAEMESLKAEMESMQQNAAKTNVQLEVAVKMNKEFKDRMNTMCEEVKNASEAKKLAEQQLTSVEFEFEQYKIQSKRREQELVHQIDDAGTEQVIKHLKDKVKVLSEGQKALETELWEKDSHHKTEVDDLLKQLAEVNRQSEVNAGQNELYRKLQNDYDEVSEQLVDLIQENDKLKAKFNIQSTAAAASEKKIEELQQNIDRLVSRQSTRTPDAVNVKLSNGFDALCIVLAAYNGECDKLSAERKELCDKLKAQADMYDVEVQTVEKLRNELQQMLEQQPNNEQLMKQNEELKKYQQELDELNNNVQGSMTQIDELKSENLQLKDDIQSQREDYEKQIADLNNNHKTIMAESVESHTKEIDDLKSEKSSLKEKLSKLTVEYDQHKLFSNELEHDKVMFEQAYNHCRLAEQFIENELQVLRNQFMELQMSVATQELDHLKLQKTISEHDETTRNASIFNATAETSRLDANQTGRGTPTENVSPPPNQNEFQLASIKQRLLTVHPNADSAESINIDDVLDKVIYGNQQYSEAIEYLLRIPTIALNTTIANRTNIVEIIQFYEQHDDELAKKLKNLNNRCNQIEVENKGMRDENANLQLKNDQNIELISSLQRDIHSGNERIQQIINDEKMLREQFENEKNAQELKLADTIREFTSKVAQHEEREKMLNDQNNDLNELKTKQRLEIARLQQMIAENGEMGSEISYLKTNINEKTERLNAALAEIESLTASLKATMAQNGELNANLLNVQQISSEKDETIAALQTKAQKVERLESLDSEKTTTISQLEQNLQATEAKLDAANNEISIANAKMSTQLKEMQKMQETSEIESKKWLNEIDELKNKIPAQKLQLEEALATCNAALLEKETENKKLMDEIVPLKIKLAQNVEMEKQLTQMNQASAAEIAEIDNKLKQALSEVDYLKVSFSDSQHARKQEHEQTNLLRQRISTLTAENKALTAENAKLQKTISEQATTIAKCEKDIKRLTEFEQKMGETLASNFEIRVQLDTLKQQNQALQRKFEEASSTPKARKAQVSPKQRCKVDVDSLIDENNSLKTMQKEMFKEIDELRKNSQNERKLKRQSTHDDTRRISGFSTASVDTGTQTDPCDEKCQCTVMNSRIKTLQLDIKIKDAKFNTLKRDTGITQLEQDKIDLTKKLDTTKSALNKVSREFEKLEEKHEMLQTELAMVRAATAPKTVSSVNTQTDPVAGRAFGDEMYTTHLEEKYKKAKRAYQELFEKYTKSKAQDQEKATLIQSLRTNIETLQKDLVILKDKYETAKAILVMRQECEKQRDEARQQIEILQKKLDEMQAKLSEERQKKGDLEQEMAEVKESLKRISHKYEVAKGILEYRNTKIQQLKQQVENNENRPANHHHA